MTKIARNAMAGLLAIVLLVVAWFVVTTQIVDRKSDRARVQVEMIANALREFAGRNGRFPMDKQGLAVLIEEGQFRSEALIDPWGQPIAYRCLQADCKKIEVKATGKPPDEVSGNTKGLSLEIEHK